MAASRLQVYVQELEGQVQAKELVHSQAAMERERL
jgi:hypothetical protein